MNKIIIFFIVVLVTVPSAAAQIEASDLHSHLLEANRAQIVMLAELDLLPGDQAIRIAEALRKTAAEDENRSAARTANYRQLENRLVDLIGPEATNIHVGRSNNDLGSTINRMLMREMLLNHLDRINDVRTVLHQMAAEHHETVMPGFTHAVQAQPTTLSHFLLAFDSSLQRDTERLREVYARLNTSPLGSGAFTTSSLTFDRELLAELLGFQGLVENSYDAIMVATADSKAEFMSALGLSALNIGRFVQYFLFQYADSSPGMLLTGSIVSSSSSMPQKRNPSAVERLRLRASDVVANSYASALFVHNTPMYEVKEVREDHLLRLERFSNEATQMYEQLTRALESIIIQKDVLREKVDGDYSTMTELAELLLREEGVPFRVGHQVASELSAYGRESGKRPMDLTYSEVSTVYQRVTGETLSLSNESVQQAFNSLEFIRSRQGIGGPQPAETKRMLKANQRNANETNAWVNTERERLQRASADLHRRFNTLADGRNIKR